MKRPLFCFVFLYPLVSIIIETKARMLLIFKYSQKISQNLKKLV